MCSIVVSVKTLEIYNPPPPKKRVVFLSGNFWVRMVKISQSKIAPLGTGNYDSKDIY